jgi:hypothetical protein
MGAPEIAVPITLLLTKELTVKGSFRYGVRLSIYGCRYGLTVIVAWRLPARYQPCRSW